MRGALLASVLVILATPYAAINGQAAHVLSAGSTSRPWYNELEGYRSADSTPATSHHRAMRSWKVPERAAKYAPIASVVIPGSGQVLLGNDRFIGYVAVEALSWWKYVKDVGERRDDEAAYKRLARRQARAPFTNGSPDLLPDADWAYYEKMRDYKESGAFSLTTTGPVVPETDAATYNGSRWQLAQNTFSTRQAAMEQYMRDAIRPEFSWSWKSAQFQYDIFKRTTEKRNDAYRAGLADLMVIGANHILSMVDAFSTVRLRASTDANGATVVGARVRW
jgi:hypothetical protein